MVRPKFGIISIPDVVFFPNTVLPVDVTDPIYISMVLTSIENGMFLSVLPSPGQIKQGQICAIGRPILLNDSNKDRIRIALEGIGKVILNTPLQNIPYPIWEGHFLEEIGDGGILINSGIERLNRIFNKWINLSISNSLDRENFLKQINNINQIVDYISMFLIRDVELKLIFLKTNSIFEKINMLNLLIPNEESPHIEDPGIIRVLKFFETMDTHQESLLKAS
ncbi:MAG: hypothetical protein A2504_16605 [Bdellovibrionales bacterium RIFOXYD12_FULL_39_22]|nr:MAG: hypothetical protein A2385_14460 [Bdellovibrionales bacterium RIFOXYB1_FULL_39_21]OFZ44994.1 MAG: hypothetical protein A2485_13885 [Bdellovibrionales bacterium RIFOXYC12_FULL_39_17]OFZ49432.1 MAG: hypothetical protein A2404_08370 [Bdellovibrionales bacterium RIFOXYC1_FULL_39_130]OFZ73389.1 MAG: hypothetical protein A2451_00875 [Bdellovibrionales bacterium RIFOXYC2_FULL_39_8]OFZ77171.1 MAG: hypothetical protein A2560_07895 [Bdellovibrionales bacterium RIFOXYD1_FULL_39_84]OFZ95616.1 MAG: